MTAPLDPAPAPDPWRYRLRIPPLPYARYRRASALIFRHYTRGFDLRGFLIAMAVALPVGMAGGYAIGWSGTSLDIVLAADRPSFALYLSGVEAALALVVLAPVMMLALRWLTLFRHGRILRRIHAASRVMNAENELRVGEDGLEWAGPDGTTATRWSGITAILREGDMHVLRLDGASFLWLPDAALGDAARRDEILGFVAERMARATAASQQPRM